MLEYTTPHTPQLNGFIERIFTFIKEGALAMLLKAKLNDTAQKILWSEAFHIKRVRNIMATTGSTRSLHIALRLFLNPSLFSDICETSKLREKPVIFGFYP